MTRIHNHRHHDERHNDFVLSRAGAGGGLSLTRREFLKSGMVLLSGAALPQFLADLGATGVAQEFTGKRIYLAPDDHTDLFWTADLPTYKRAFSEMLDYYLDLADQTRNELPEFQSRWNCDGSYWVWVYERDKSRVDFERLIERIRSGHISVPLNALCICPGGAPAEAILRGMYYSGKLERRHQLRFPIAYSMENQTLPFGLGALWSGSGATFSWKGICGCATKVPDAWDREHDIYWWVGADGSRLLMKWNSMLQGNQYPGGYAEARYPESAVNYVDSDANFKARYPYQVIGVFGHGWDDLQTQTDRFVTVAKNLSNQNFKVIVSNEIDFAQDFEKTYGNDIPSLSASFGNEWDLDCASMAEVSARYKRAVEKVRTAEGLAALVSLKQNNFMQGREEARDLAWMNMGLFWEHNWQGAPWDGLVEKSIAWHRRITGEIEAYVNTLHKDALSALGGMIRKTVEAERYFVFNPLNWVRTDYADYEYLGAGPVHVVSVENDQETPSQFVWKDGKRWLRILAENVPSVGYKVYEIRQGVGQSFPTEITISGNEIENQFYKLTVAERGAITSLVDKTREDRQLAAEINGCFINDLGPGTGTLQVENEGPVSVTLLARTDTPLAHESRISLFRGMDRIEIQNDITQNFNAAGTWGFCFAIPDPDMNHEEVGAILRARLTNDGGHYSPRNARYDWLTLNHFVDVSAGTFGMTLSNADCFFMKVGNSTVGELDTITPQISVLVGGNDLNGGGVLGDQGGDDHFLQRFALRSHASYDAVSAMKFALEHQNPFAAGRVDGGDAYPERTYSFLSVDEPGVLLWALKPAEDGLESGLVARFWNLSSDQIEFSLSVDGGIKEALALTHIETSTGIATVRDGRLVDVINRQQIRTYAVFPYTTSISKPGIPVLLSPANGGLVSTLQPTLDWKDSTPLLDHYQLQVARNNTFTDLVVDEADLTTSEFTFISNLDPGRRYFWRVRAFNILDQTKGWSTPWNFRTPLAAPTLGTPSCGASLLADRPTFDWLDVEGAASYTIQVSPTTSFGTLLLNATVSPSNYQITKDLPQNKTLYWRVKARNPVVSSPWSVKCSFKTGNPPSVPLLASPANNALVKDYTPALKWYKSSIPSGTLFKHYELQLDNNNDFSSPEIEFSTSDGLLAETTFTPPSDLAPNTKYYWRVRAVNLVGADEHASGWSAVRSFRTVMLPPTLLLPADGSMVGMLKPFFDWEDVEGAASYTIQISTSVSFSTYLVNTNRTVSNFTPATNLPKNKTIYWRVRANGPNGPSLWSKFQFVTPP